MVRNHSCSLDLVMAEPEETGRVLRAYSEAWLASDLEAVSGSEEFPRSSSVLDLDHEPAR